MNPVPRLHSRGFLWYGVKKRSPSSGVGAPVLADAHCETVLVRRVHRWGIPPPARIKRGLEVRRQVKRELIKCGVPNLRAYSGEALVPLQVLKLAPATKREKMKRPALAGRSVVLLSRRPFTPPSHRWLSALLFRFSANAGSAPRPYTLPSPHLHRRIPEA